MKHPLIILYYHGQGANAVQFTGAATSTDGLSLDGDVLQIFWSRVGDAPEPIVVSQVELSLPDWNELRDPFVFDDAHGQRYLLYVGAGERAIGLARIVPRPSE